MMLFYKQLSLVRSVVISSFIRSRWFGCLGVYEYTRMHKRTEKEEVSPELYCG